MLLSGNYKDLPYPKQQIAFLILLLFLTLTLIFTFALLIFDFGSSIIFSAAKWAGTAAGLAVCAAIFQISSLQWLDRVEALFSDADAFPYGPPSHETRRMSAGPDNETLFRLFHWIWYDRRMPSILGFLAGFFTILSYWID